MPPSELRDRDARSYERFSSSPQEKGASIARQRRLARETAEWLGLNLIETNSDLGVSAWKGLHREEGALSKIIRVGEQGLAADAEF